MAPAGAFSRVATRCTRVPASPITFPPKRPAMSRSVWGFCLPRVMSNDRERRRSEGLAAGTVLRLLAFGERLEHPVRDVHPRAAIHRLLQDEIEFLRFGDLPDHAVGAFEQRRQLLVPPQVQVL